MTLPGIGESKADAIIKYREENGSFRSIDDLKKISGIKDGVISKFKDKIVI
jgi:competence protein ComEA